MAEQITTCQICGRAIKSSKGVIAHHGYRRPGDGWQTASCFGARHLPYEISRDLIPVAIEKIHRHIATVKNDLERFITNPPDKLTRMVHHREVVATRPAGFVHNGYCSYSMKDVYQLEYQDRRYRMEQDIIHSKAQIEFLEERYAAWVSPENK